MKIFITAQFKQGENKLEIEHLCSLVREAGFEDFCFIRDVENYQKIFDNPKDLMIRARQEINGCDALLIDLTEKSTGRAIEAGMAFSMGKKIIVIAKKETPLKDTAKGIADLIIEYDKIDDIVPGLRNILAETNK
jgi:nucleoside 2-deoxyribosyltransferase